MRYPDVEFLKMFVSSVMKKEGIILEKEKIKDEYAKGFWWGYTLFWDFL